MSQLFSARLSLCLLEEEFKNLKEEYEDYRRIAESSCNNKKVKCIRDHLSWYNRDDLKKKAKEVAVEEALEYSCDEARKRERIRRRKQREERRREEEKKRAAERKALEELMEKERKERRQRKNTEN